MMQRLCKPYTHWQDAHAPSRLGCYLTAEHDLGCASAWSQKSGSAHAALAALDWFKLHRRAIGFQTRRFSLLPRMTVSKPHLQDAVLLHIRPQRLGRHRDAEVSGVRRCWKQTRGSGSFLIHRVSFLRGHEQSSSTCRMPCSSRSAHTALAAARMPECA